MNFKIIPFFFLLILSITGVSAWTYTNSYSHGTAKAVATISGSEAPSCDGTFYNIQNVGLVCVGSWYVDIGCGGDYCWIWKSLSSWPSCGEYGCTGSEYVSSGRYYFDYTEDAVPHYVACAYDLDEKGDDYAWAYQCGGRLTTYGNGEYGARNVDCYQDVDCGVDHVCIKDPPRPNYGQSFNWYCLYSPPDEPDDPDPYIPPDEPDESDSSGGAFNLFDWLITFLRNLFSRFNPASLTHPAQSCADQGGGLR